MILFKVTWIIGEMSTKSKRSAKIDRAFVSGDLINNFIACANIEPVNEVTPI
jgi:hypothetical protein